MRRLLSFYSGQYLMGFAGAFLIIMPLGLLWNQLQQLNLSSRNVDGREKLACNDEIDLARRDLVNDSNPLSTETLAPELCKIIIGNREEITRQFQGLNLDLKQVLFSEFNNLKREIDVDKIELNFPYKVANWPQIDPQARLAKVPVLMYHDIIAKKEVFFDVTPEELAQHFELIKSEKMTPISLTQLVNHLQSGSPLPDRPILLTFDDGYRGHYEYVFPLLKQYNYPAVFSIYVDKMEKNLGRPGISWQQLQEMANHPLVTIASHSITHPQDLRLLPQRQLEAEIIQSKQILQDELGQAIFYFTYPVGKSDERVREVVKKAGYLAALSMDDNDEHFAGESSDLLTIGRFGQSQLKKVVKTAWGGPPLPAENFQFNFNNPIVKREHEIDGVKLILISGGKPRTIHADSRYQVAEIIKNSEAIAGVDGTYFSMEYLDSDEIIGPVLSSNRQEFIAGKPEDRASLKGRPLVLIGEGQVKFIPFNPDSHNTLAGIEGAMRSANNQLSLDYLLGDPSLNHRLPWDFSLTDAFVAGAWLVRDGNPQPAASFNGLFDFDALRHRAFWGIDRAGKPVIGVSTNMVDSVTLGEVLHKLGLRDAVMLDSGGSTSLAYQGESLVGYLPRPVPHVVALFENSRDSAVFDGQ